MSHLIPQRSRIRTQFERSLRQFDHFWNFQKFPTFQLPRFSAHFATCLKKRSWRSSKKKLPPISSSTSPATSDPSASDRIWIRIAWINSTGWRTCSGRHQIRNATSSWWRHWVWNCVSVAPRHFPSFLTSSCITVVTVVTVAILASAAR